MLTSLQVRNFAIIDRIEVDFSSGMTVLTGETGAGKSILVDALGLVLGERGGAGLVRDGAERADFSAEFDLAAHPGAKEWLRDQALDADGECVLRRTIAADGRSRSFVNGTTATLQTVKSLGELLLDIHGQHFHQSLGRRDVQRDLLDHFGQLQSAGSDTARNFAAWQQLVEELDQLQVANDDRVSRIDLLRFQMSELEALNLAENEVAELDDERRALQNSGKIADGLSQALALAFDADEGNAHSLLAQAERSLETLTGFDRDIDSATAMLRESSIQLTEAVDRLRRSAERLQADPERRDWVEERLAAIFDIARKHRVEPAELPQLQARLAGQLDDLENAERHGEDLAARAQEARTAYLAAASALTAGRTTAAGTFAAAVTAAMADLGMPGGRFEVELPARDETRARAYGMEDVEYRISANPGQAPQALARIASGGELSRMSLAIQVIASDGSVIPTMIFDEVDSGVGGGVAEMVGRRLRDLAGSRQVLCVTHLPQVASQATHHLRINKMTDGKSTRTSVSVLGDDERIEELARMLGGVKITQRTREHAAEMLAHGSKDDKPRTRRAGSKRGRQAGR